MGELRVTTVGTLAGLDDALAVRRAVFIEEQGVSEEEEIDAQDGDPAGLTRAVHVVAYLAGRWRPGASCSMRRLRSTPTSGAWRWWHPSAAVATGAR